MIPRILPIFSFGLMSASAATISFQEGVSPSGAYDHITKDIRSGGATNNGAQALVGSQPGTGGVGLIRTVMAFGLGSVPAGSIINSISLTLTTDSPAHSGTIAGVGTINLHEVIPNGVASNNMVDASTSWSSWSATSTWTTTGGDYNTTAMSSSVLTNTNSDTKLENGETAAFGSTLAFVAAAQAALNAGLPLEFILIAPTAEANGTTANFFRFASDTHATTSWRPLLTIDYTIPEPSSMIFLALSGVAGLSFRRRTACL